MMVDMLLVLEWEEQVRVVLQMLGREDVEDGALFLERSLWLEMRRGI